MLPEVGLEPTVLVSNSVSTLGHPATSDRYLCDIISVAGFALSACDCAVVMAFSSCGGDICGPIQTRFLIQAVFVKRSRYNRDTCIEVSEDSFLLLRCYR